MIAQSKADQDTGDDDGAQWKKMKRRKRDKKIDPKQYKARWEKPSNPNS
jgi:predicted transcriptional regulator